MALAMPCLNEGVMVGLSLRMSDHAVGEGCLDRAAGLQRARNGQGGDRCSGQFGGNTIGNDRQPQNAYIERLTCRLDFGKFVFG